MKNTGYYAVITKKFRLMTEHEEWINKTQKLYNDVVQFYYRLYIQYPEVHEMGFQNAMRRLEQISIVGRDKSSVPEPLPWKKLPLYFRRSAISQAIGAGKSFLSRENQLEPTKNFDMSILLYKGMYKDMDGHKIKIRLTDGDKWHWVRCRMTGHKLFEEEVLSPRLVITEKRYELHVPVRVPVLDGRTLKKRMDNQLKICSVQFYNQDILAVCCIMDVLKNIVSVHFIRGGNDLKRKNQELLEKIEKSRKSRGNQVYPSENKRYWTKLKNINENMVHQISHEIIEYSKKHQVSVIVLPKYSEDFSRKVMSNLGIWSPVYIGYRVQQKLNYKAWMSGILIAETNVNNIRKSCSLCGAEIYEENNYFVCANGHKGDRRLNSVRNLGYNFLKSTNKLL